MPFATCGRAAAASLILILLAACSSPPPPDAWMVPDESGLYAATGDDIARIDGDAAFEQATWDRRQVTPAQAEFVVFQEGQDLAANAPGLITLRRVGWVRSRLAADGSVLPNDGSNWDVPTLDAYIVPVRFAAVAGRADTIRVTPVQPLAPGLYSLEFRGAQVSRVARLGVGWPNLDKDAYASAHCLDRLVGNQGEGALQPCGGPADTVAHAAAQNPLAGADANPLLIELEPPQVVMEDGLETMVISGRVINAGETTHVVPGLVASMEDAQGRLLSDWAFRVAESELQPGETAPFKLRFLDREEAAARVRVDFAGAAG